MILLITLPLALIISLLWYLPPVKAQGNNRVLRKRDYFRIALTYGFCTATLLIIVTEIAWDSIIGHRLADGLLKDIIMSFLRAALLEEGFKFLAFIKAKNNLHLSRRIDYVLCAGMIGVVYGFVEKTVLGSLGAVIVGLAVPMHIMWQFNQGAHYFEYEKAKAAGDSALAKKELFMATLLPFLFHGCWDSAFDLVGFGLDQEGFIPNIAAVVLMLVLVIGGIIYSVRTVKKACAIAKAEDPLQTVTD